MSRRQQEAGEIHRRAVLGLGAAGLLSAYSMRAAGAAPVRSFPPGFAWGAATAAHQVEGNNVNSDWWTLETVPGSPIAEPSGDACDHYHRVEQDIALLAALGLGAYRFSIEWARIEPAPGRYSIAELNHYRRVLETCRRHGLRTMVTLHHFTSPRWLTLGGGFEELATVGAFARYADRVVRHCGDLIDWICTINEANLSFNGFVDARALIAKAAAANGSARFASFLFDDEAKSKPIVRACHRAAKVAIKAVRPNLPVGLTIAMDDVQDAPGEPGYGVRERSRLYDVWLETAQEDDFVGVQNYTRVRFGHAGRVAPSPQGLLTQIGQEYYPEGLAGAVRYAAQIARVPVLVTENGIGTADDRLRVRYIHSALSGLHRIIEDGVEVRGYFHWSAMDNFEWWFGYKPKFGLVAVDRVTQRRTLKSSAFVLGDIARTNALPASTLR